MKWILVAVAAAAVVAVVVVALVGGGSAHHGGGSTTGATASGGELAVAAGYLGISPPQLRRELRAGHSLSAVASGAGKSASGVVAAVVASRKATLDKLRAAGTISAAEEQRRLSRLRARLTNTNTGTQRPASITAHDAAAVTAYLGISRARLTSELRSGKSLAQIASAVPGRSPAGLTNALVKERRAQLNAEVAAGRLVAARRAAFLVTLRRRMTVLVNRSHPFSAALHLQG
jgi:hypothetical protein